MDFFAGQEAARRRTGLLLVYLLLAICAIVVAVYFAVTICGAFAFPAAVRGWRHPLLFAWVSGGTILLVAGGALYKRAALSRGGAVIAEALAGRPLSADTTEPLERRLLDVVEEMAIASGCARPPVYVLDGEAGINAFAAGFSPDDAVVAVTRGTLDTLTRAELQGVVAHEFSHILNGDMRLNLELISILNGILLIALVGRGLLRVRRSTSSTSRRGGGQQLGLGLALLLIGGIGVFFAKLIKSGVSRQREFLADASAVQFTRHPEGIASALKKIGGFAAGSRITHPRAEEASHMFFGNGMGHVFAGWLATHPPLRVRIARIDPSFDGEFPLVGEHAGEETGRTEPGAEGFAAEPPGEEATAFVDRIGRPTPATVARSRSLIGSLAPSLVAAARHAVGARAIAYGLLLGRNPAVRARQQERLATTADPAAYLETVRLAAEIDRVEAAARFPLLQLAVPALRALSSEQRRVFLETVDVLIRADERVDLFEYALSRFLRGRLAERVRKRRRARPSAGSVRQASRVALSALARAGASDEGAVAVAFAKGMDRLGRGPGMSAPVVAEESGLGELDQVLERLANAPPYVRKSFLEGAAACVLADAAVTTEEYELLRAIAASLGCPVPPLVGTVPVGRSTI